MLVANPVNGIGGPANKFGSSGGTILGTPATTTMVVIGTVPDTTNIRELTYTLDVNGSNPLIGSPVAIRITAQNMLVQNGVPDPNAPPNGTNNARLCRRTLTMCVWNTFLSQDAWR